MSKIYAMYDDDATLLHGAEKLVAKDVHIKDVFSPFPIHGIDPVIGVRKTRLAICAFIYGLTGMSLALIGMYYFMIVDWPMNIGGKPNHYFYQNIPAFIPITFELTVLFAAIGMTVTFYTVCGMGPGVTNPTLDDRITDDKFCIAFDDSEANPEDVKSFFKQTGAAEVHAKTI